MKVGSLFAGIGGFDLGFERAGFEVAWCVEIDRNARAVLARRFPKARILEDVTKVDPHDLETVDVICGGFPCQDLSVAGKRAGLAGERSGLFHDAMRIVRTVRPRLLVLENVPGLLSSNHGRDFGTVLREVGEGWDCAEVAWRVLDSQFFGVAQRRRRVFVVGSSRIGCAEEVLALAEGSGGSPPSRGEARKAVAADAARCADVGRWWDGGDCAATLTKQNANGSQRMPDKGNFGAIVIDRAAFNNGTNAAYDPRIEESDCMSSIIARGPHAVAFRKSKRAQPFSPHGHYRYEASDQSATLQDRENRQGGHNHLVAQTFGISEELTAAEDVMPTIQRGGDGGRHEFVAQAFRKSKRAQSADDDETCVDDGLANTLNGFDTGDTRTTHAIAFHPTQDPISDTERTHALGCDSKQGCATVAVAIPIEDGHEMTKSQNGLGIGSNGDPSYTIDRTGSQSVATPMVVPFAENFNAVSQVDIAPTMSTSGYSPTQNAGGCGIAIGMVVRRLTPVECERLQGFPDGWTDIGTDKPTADSHRYKQLGNAVTVNVAEWIARRAHDALTKEAP